MRHYVWNEDGTGLVEKGGEIDMSRPFFTVPEGVDPMEATGGRPYPWPDGWVEIGHTIDPGESA